MAIIDQADQAFNQQFTIKNGTSTIRNEFFGRIGMTKTVQVDARLAQQLRRRPRNRDEMWRGFGVFLDMREG